MRRRARNKSRTRNNGAAPSAFGTGILNAGPPRHTSIRVHHREYLTDIVGGGATFRNEYSMNPGMDNRFPWLSRLASAYEKYDVHNFQVEWVPSIPTTYTGSISIVPDYDPADDDSGLTKQALLAMQDATTSNIWRPTIMRCTPSCLRHPEKLFVRTVATLPSNLDIKFYDFAKVVVDVSSTESGILGSLYLTYDITLSIPQISGDEPAALFSASGSGVGMHPWANVTTELDNIPVKLSADEIEFYEPGTYELQAYAGGSLNSVNPNMIDVSPGAALTAINYVNGIISHTQNIVDQTFRVVVNNTASLVNPAIIRWVFNAAASITASQLLITPLKSQVQGAFTVSVIPADQEVRALLDKRLGAAITEVFDSEEDYQAYLDDTAERSRLLRELGTVIAQAGLSFVEL